MATCTYRVVIAFALRDVTFGLFRFPVDYRIDIELPLGDKISQIDEILILHLAGEAMG